MGSTPAYLGIGPKAKQLRDLGMSDKAIGRALGVSDKTVAKAVDRLDAGYSTGGSDS